MPDYPDVLPDEPEFRVVRVSDYIEGPELGTAPAAPISNKGRLYFRDNGSGKTQLVVQFATGVVQVVATEP